MNDICKRLTHGKSGPSNKTRVVKNERLSYLSGIYVISTNIISERVDFIINLSIYDNMNKSE